MSEPLDFGEPWTTDEYAMYAWDRGRRTMGDDNEACFRARGAGRGASVAEQQTAITRVVACVNACAGMADPVTEVAALHERAEKLQAQAGAWCQVFDALRELVPEFTDMAPSGVGCAMAAIRGLHERAEKLADQVKSLGGIPCA